MTVAELSVRKPITIVMVYILICVISCVFIPKLGIALYPKTTMPVLSVFANYPGVGPEEVDKNVTQLIVARVKGVQGIKNITSNSSTGSARPLGTMGRSSQWVWDTSTVWVKDARTYFSRSIT